MLLSPGSDDKSSVEAMIQRERIKFLNEKHVKRGDYVLYWMQASQRTEYNHALEYAVLKANEMKKPLIVYFGLTEDFPEANERHYCFMLEGLKEIQSDLEERNIKMVVFQVSPELGLIELSKDASLVVVDCGYLKIERKWRNNAASNISCLLVQVESNVIVPVEEASHKEEYSAATFRPKIKKKLNHYLFPLTVNYPEVDSLHLNIDSLDINDIKKTIYLLNIDRSVRKVNYFHGGAREAKKQLEIFLKEKIDRYRDLRNDPTSNYQSNMSPYLHFGQISPLYIALKVLKTKSPGTEAYLEELIVRRELSMNFVFYNQNYDSIECLPNWARKTLLEHKKDRREYVYALDELENAETHDPYWNAAQEEMRNKGKMHGYMRMYWGKKILEWTETPEEAFKIALHLNNKYELDGRDPNGLAGVAWCFGKHDQPWKERKIFGKVRYMSAEGLKRKFEVDKYVEKKDF